MQYTIEISLPQQKQYRAHNGCVWKKKAPQVPKSLHKYNVKFSTTSAKNPYVIIKHPRGHELCRFELAFKTICENGKTFRVPVFTRFFSFLIMKNREAYNYKNHPSEIPTPMVSDSVEFDEWTMFFNVVYDNWCTYDGKDSDWYLFGVPSCEKNTFSYKIYENVDIFRLTSKKKMPTRSITYHNGEQVVTQEYETTISSTRTYYQKDERDVIHMISVIGRIVQIL